MHPEHRSIGELAYRLWQARGCPDGTAEKDWLEAEKQLRLDAEQRREAQSGRKSDVGDRPSDVGEASRGAARGAADETILAPEQPAARSPGKRPSRARTLKSKSASSKPVSPESSTPGDAAG